MSSQALSQHYMFQNRQACALVDELKTYRDDVPANLQVLCSPSGALGKSSSTFARAICRHVAEASTGVVVEEQQSEIGKAEPDMNSSQTETGASVAMAASASSEVSATPVQEDRHSSSSRRPSDSPCTSSQCRHRQPHCVRALVPSHWIRSSRGVPCAQGPGWLPR